jgi:protein-S-isoprenylcysteine O-methyltransferase Ste14
MVSNALVIGTLVVWFIGELRQGFQRRSNAAKNDRYSLLLLRGSIAIGVLLALQALRVSATAFGINPFVLCGGVLLMWAGIGLRWWSFWSLGQYFTFAVMTSHEQPVITAGPYRLLRHPSYAGILLTLAGLGVLFGNWLSVAALVMCPFIGFAYRIRVEEAALSNALGAVYVTYARSRKRLIPLLW